MILGVTPRVVAQYGLRGQRIGEATHPGPVQTRSARSTQFDSQGTSAGYTRVVRRTQFHGDSDVPRMRSVGRFSILSTDSEDEVEMGVVQVNPSPMLSATDWQCQSGRFRQEEARGKRLPQASTVHVPESVVEALERDLTATPVVAARRPTRRVGLVRWKAR